MPFKRLVLLYLNAIFPFAYFFRDYLNGRIALGMLRYFRDYVLYKRADAKCCSGFPAHFRTSFPIFIDRFESAGSFPRHYFHQDLWGATKVFQSKVRCHFDIGSRLDGFIAHCLPFCEVVMLDIRPLASKIRNLKFIQLDCTDMREIESGTINSLSSFHAIEHFGLGRYGDRIDPRSYLSVLSEISRVMAKNGNIYIGVPIGRKRVEFNAHRIFDPAEFAKLLPECSLVEFSVIDDNDTLIESVLPEDYRELNYGCGLFHFQRR